MNTDLRFISDFPRRLRQAVNSPGQHTYSARVTVGRGHQSGKQIFTYLKRGLPVTESSFTVYVLCVICIDICNVLSHNVFVAFGESVL